MGLLQKACETYDCHAHLAGVERDKHETLAPVSHIITSAQIEITIDQDGNFMNASAVDKSESKIIIPVTEDSGGRTSAPCAHPLCDQLVYLADYNETKHDLYVEQLTDWAESEYSHPMLKPILAYVKGGTILNDLVRADLIKLDEKGHPEKDKLLVRWRVNGLGENSGACWKNQALFQAFIAYYSARQEDAEQALCMISGQQSTPAKQHPKGIIPINGNAKLISANDKNGFTYRGRFTEDWQAGTISYMSSQKAHNALRWLAAEQGARAVFGGRTFLCWNPQGKPVASVTSPIARQTPKPPAEPTEYQEELKKTLDGYRNELPEDTAGVVIAAFDAATTGRLSLTYYNELMASDFLDRLYYWDSTCCWWERPNKFKSPPLWQIVNCAFGTQREEKGKIVLKTDDRVMKQQMQRLISCRVDKAHMPMDITMALFHRVSTPLAFEPNVWEWILSTACAVIRKYHYDRDKEEWEMALEPNKQDRSYQYGRLLAVLDKIERDTYDKDETRETNAMRMLSVFSRRPRYASRIIWEQVKKAYLPRLKPSSRIYYENLMQEIYDMLLQFPEDEQNRPLGDSYPSGYYLQRKALYTSNKENKTEVTENEHSEE